MLQSFLERHYTGNSLFPDSLLPKFTIPGLATGEIHYYRIRYLRNSLRASSLTTDFAKPNLRCGRSSGAASRIRSLIGREILPHFLFRPIASLRSEDALLRFASRRRPLIGWIPFHPSIAVYAVLTVYFNSPCDYLYVYISQGSIGRFYLASDKAWLMWPCVRSFSLPFLTIPR